MNKYSPKNLDKIEVQRLYDTGLSIRELAKKLNVSPMTIQKLKLKTRNFEDSQKFIKRQPMSVENRQKLSDLAKERKLGGYRPHPNKGKYYNNIWFDSNWEIKVAISLDDENIRWERPSIGYVWTDCNKKYYPDFYLLDYDIYLDPKNSFLRIKDEIKIQQAQIRNNIRVIVLNENQLTWNEIKKLI